jgi:hypothetical protein
MQHVYGYIQAQVTTSVLEQAVKDGDLSGKGIRKALTELGTLSFNHLQGDITYGQPADRKLPKTTSIYRYDHTKPYGLLAKSVLYQAQEQLPTF